MFAKSIDDMLNKWTWLREFKPKLKMEKCHYFQKCIVFLGYVMLVTFHAMIRWSCLHYFNNCLVTSLPLNEYCELAVLHMTMVYTHNWHAYGHGLFSLSYMTILVVNNICINTCLILYTNRGTTVLCKLLLLHPLPFTKTQCQLKL